MQLPTYIRNDIVFEGNHAVYVGGAIYTGLLYI